MSHEDADELKGKKQVSFADDGEDVDSLAGLKKKKKSKSKSAAEDMAELNIADQAMNDDADDAVPDFTKLKKRKKKTTAPKTSDATADNAEIQDEKKELNESED